MISFSVGLVDKVSSPASAMRASLTAAAAKTTLLEGQMKSLGKEVDALRAKQIKYREAGMAGVAAQAGLEISKLRLKMKGLSDEMKDAKSAHASASKGLKTITDSASDMSAELGPAVAILAVYGAAITALAGALFEGAKLSLSASAFKKETLDAFSALQGSAAMGAATLGIIRDLESSVPEAESTLVERAKGLLAQGMDPSKLKASLLDISNVAAVLGDEGAHKITSIMEKTLTSGKFKIMPKSLVGTGITEADLAKQLGVSPAAFESMMKKGLIGADKGLDALHAVIDRKLGGAAAEKLNTLDAISNKLGDNVKRIFEDVKTGPFLEGVGSLVKLLDQSTGSGKTLKWIVESIFNTGFKESGGILLLVKHGIQNLIIEGLKLYIAMKPSIAQFKALGASAKKSEQLKAALIGIAVIAGILALSLGIVLAVMMGIGVAIVLVVGAVGIGMALLVGKIVKAMGSLKLLGSKERWKSLAADMIQGLIDGLMKGIKPLQAVVHKVAEVLPKSFADKLEIHSPSRVGIKQGQMYPEGVAIGMEKGSSRVATAATAVAGKASSGGDGGGASNNGGRTIHVDKLEINNNGVGSSGEAISMTATALSQILEQLALKEGLGSVT